MQSQYPSTIIDLHGEGGTVTQTKRHNEYHVIRIESERDVLSQLQAGRHQRNPEHSEELFHEVDDSSELVQEALQEVFRPHRSAVRQALLSQFFRMIYRKALILVQYADAKGASPQNPLPDDVVSRIRKVWAGSCFPNSFPDTKSNPNLTTTGSRLDGGERL